MNTLEDAFLDSLASRLVVEDTAQAKEATQVAQAQPKPRSIIEQQIGTPEEILASANPETAAGIAKGMVQGFVGLPGDLVSVVRGLFDFAKSGGDVDELLAGLEKPTGLPTTEDVKKFLDERGLKVGTGEGTPEKVGEFAAPGGYIKGAKAGARAVKSGAGKVKEVLETPPKGAINPAPRSSQGTVKLADDLEVEIAPAERTKNFKNWFGNSKVVDEKGKPLVVYHGGMKGITEFKNPDGKYKTGIFFTSSQGVANAFGRGGETYPVYLSIKKPFILDANENNYASIPTPKQMKSYVTTDEVDTDLIAEWAFKNNYDGVIIKNVLEGRGDQISDVYIASKNTQIKSIGNRGTFDPKDPNILRGAAVTPVAPAVMQDEEKK